MHYTSIPLSIIFSLLVAIECCDIVGAMGDQDICRPSQTATRDGTLPESVTKTIDHELTKEEIRNLLLKEANYDIDAANNTLKRKDYLSWDDYFVAVAFLSAQRSKDPKAPKGACIVDDSNRIVGIGYNGFPRGCLDDLLPWNNVTNAPFLHTPSPYECHAEINAILNKCSNDVVGARMYVDEFPSHECSKVIVQSHIKEIIYIRDDDYNSETSRASRIMLEMAGVRTTQYKPSKDSLVITLPVMRKNESEGHPDNTTTRNNEEDNKRFRELLLREANFQPTKLSEKRENVLSWDDYFMAIAFLTSKRSKDPNTQVGACIVNSETRRILACGYNGFPRGCSDEHLPWARNAESFLHKKYPFVCHAEVNAILNKCSADVQGATLYVALFPCNECAKMIIQSGIKEVVFLQDHYHDTDACRASRIMFTMAGVRMRQHIPSVETITLNFTPAHHNKPNN